MIKMRLMMRVNRKPVAPTAWTILGFFSGVLITWLFALRHTNALLDQSAALGNLSRSVEQNNLTADQVVQRLKDADFVITDYDRRKPETIVMKPEVNPFGIGGRWLILVQFKQEGYVKAISMELQPVGWT